MVVEQVVCEEPWERIKEKGEKEGFLHGMRERASGDNGTKV